MSDTIDKDWISDRLRTTQSRRCEHRGGCDKLGKYRFRLPHNDGGYSNIEYRCQDHLAADMGVPTGSIPSDTQGNRHSVAQE